MKKSLKVIAALLTAAVMSMAFASCSADDDDDGGSKTLTLAQMAANQLYIPENMTSESYGFYVTSYGGTTISYVSDKTDILSVDASGDVVITPKAGDGYDAVKVTATVTDPQGNIAKKTFNLKVWQSSKAFTDAEALAMAVNLFKTEMKAPSMGFVRTDLCSYMIFKNKTVDMTYETSEDDKDCFKHVQGDFPLTICRDIADVTVTVNASFSINGGSPVKASATLKLPAIRTFAYDEHNGYTQTTVFDSKKLTNTEVVLADDGNSKYVYASEYSYTIDPEKSLITLTLLRRSDVDAVLGTDETKLYTPAEYKTAVGGKMAGVIAAYKKICNSMFSDSIDVTFDDLMTVFAYMYTQEEGQGQIINITDDTMLGYLNGKDAEIPATKAAYDALGAEDKAAALAKIKYEVICMAMGFVAEGFGVAAPSEETKEAIDAYFENLEPLVPYFVNRWVFSKFEAAPHTFNYGFNEDENISVNGVDFYANDSRVLGLPWYEQPSIWNNGYDNYMVSKEGVCFGGIVYNEGSWNADYTEYTQNGKTFTVTVVNNYELNLSDGSESELLGWHTIWPVWYLD